MAVCPLGSLMMTELKNNAFKLAKWAAQSILAGADLMKIGYAPPHHSRRCFRAAQRREHLSSHLHVKLTFFFVALCF